MPTEKTKAEYRRLAAHFYEKRLGGEPPTPKKITDALKVCAGEYRPAYWRRLRGALALDQEEKGYDKAAARIRETINPMTTDAHGPLDKGLRGPVPPKQRRAKSISQEDGQRLWDATGTLNDRGETRSALLLATLLGVRPAEMPGLQVDQEKGEVHVTGAKKTDDDDKRGADRVLVLQEGQQRRQVAIAVEIIREAESKSPGAMRRIQSRLDRLTRRLWPRRKARPSLYTFRHQVGSALKASGASRAAIAYCMGHQSTKSVEVYGDRRSAKRGGGLLIQVGDREAAAFEGRENHRAPHSAPAAGRPGEAPGQQDQGDWQPPTPAPYSGPGGPGMG